MRVLNWITFDLPRWGAWFGGALLLLCCFAIGLEVFARAVLRISLTHVNEFTAYALAFSGAWGIAYTLVNRAHIRVDVVYALLPVRLKALLDIFNLLLLLVFFGVLTWFAWSMAAKSYALGSRSMTPLATPVVIPQGIWVAGLTMFMCVALLLLVRAIIALSRGDLRGVRRLIGSPSAEEEAREETAEALHRLESEKETLR